MKPTINQFNLLKEYGKYFLKQPNLPENKFIIFGNGRSGSTLLVSLLNSSSKIYCDGEILNRNYIPFPGLYIKTRSSLFHQSVYGFKLLDYQLKDLQKIKKPESFILNLHKDGWKFIYLTRKNKLNYALSIVNAFHRKSFHHRYKDGSVDKKKIRVDTEEVMYWIRQGQENTLYFSDILNSIPHLKLTYEADLHDPKNHQETANQVFDYLKINTSKVDTNLVKIMPSNPVDRVDNYEELIFALDEYGYGQYL